MKEKIAVSACLLGEACRYDGKGNQNEEVCMYVEDKEVIAICPELLGGLSTPRPPCEIVRGKVQTKDGEDKSDAFHRGANASLRIIQEYGIKKVILKAKSPSCGSGQIYDGTFSQTLVLGEGITTQLLRKNGVIVVDETTIKQLK